MNGLYSALLAGERIRNKKLSKINPNLPSSENEFGEISNDEILMLKK